MDLNPGFPTPELAPRPKATEPLLATLPLPGIEFSEFKAPGNPEAWWATQPPQSWLPEPQAVLREGVDSTQVHSLNEKRGYLCAWQEWEARPSE